MAHAQPFQLSAIAGWGAKQAYGLLLVGIGFMAVVNIVNDLIGRPYYVFTRTIYLGYENNLATWYSSVLLLAAAATAWQCYRTSLRSQRRPCHGWILLACLMAVLSCDETASLHEHLHFLDRISPRLAERMPHAPWSAVFGPLGVVTAAGMAWLMRGHFRGCRRAGVLLALGAGLFLTASVGLESSINWFTHEQDQTLWDVEVICEEIGEMAGAWLMGFAAILYCESITQTQVRFE